MTSPVFSLGGYSARIGRTLRLLRELRGVSLRSMAGKMGLSVSGWSRCETGESILTVVQLGKAARVLGMPASKVLEKVEALTD